MYRLYGWRQTGSMAVEAALEEAGVAYELIPVSRPKDENLGEAFRAINPRQQLPAMMLPDGRFIAEGPAMLAHIGDAFPGAGLLPPPGSYDRAVHDRWIGFFHANVYEAMLREIYPQKYCDDPAAEGSVKRAATSFIQRHFAIFEAELGPGPFVMGARLSMIDIYVWMLTYWMEGPWLGQNCPKVMRLAGAAGARPVLAGVAARHFG